MNTLLALASGLLLVLLYPKADLTMLAPFALVPLFFACAREARWKHRFLLGWMAGVVYWFGVCSWIQFVLAVHGGMGEWGGWGTFLLFALAKAIQMGVFAALAGLLIPGRWAIPGLAALWVAIERTHAALGFTWLLLGNAGTNMGLPMRLAPITGVYGLSFLFALMNAGLLLLVLRRPRRELAWLLLVPVLYVMPALPEEVKPTDSIVSVQPNVDEERAWTPESAEAFERRLAYVSLNSALEAGAPRPRLIVWPEVPAPLYYDSDFRLRQETATLTRMAGVPLLFGTVAHTPKGEPLNSLQMVDSKGEPAGRYDKIHLVPFGEFVPPIFSFVNHISSEAGNFAPGEERVLFGEGGRRLGAFICYESAFPHFVREFTRAGADVLVNASNDGYFGHSAAREQHLLLVRMRAAENGRWILRPTNNGITASIDPAGRLRRSFPSFVEYAGRLPYSPESGLTLYVRFGDWFVWLCVLVAAGLLLLSQVPVYRRQAGAFARGGPAEGVGRARGRQG